MCDFLFKVRCACNQPSRCPNLLAITGIAFALPTALLWLRSNRTLSALTAALTATTLVYHATHNPWMRAADVLVLWTTGAVGLVQCVVCMVVDGPNAMLAIAILLLAIINAINHLPVCLDESGRIELRWHVAVHVLTTAALSLVALGWEHCASPPSSDSTLCSFFVSEQR